MKKTLIDSILAGICIGIGGAIFLAMDNKIAGALFFTVGLFTICTRSFALFTGKVGYALEQNTRYIGTLALIWVGNLIGTNLVSLALSFTRVSTAFAEKAAAMCAVKNADSPLSLFLLGIFCNILMYIAVDGFRKNAHELGKYLGLFLGVAGFILAGFEHCIADMFYFGMAGWSLQSLVSLLIITLGNIVGGLLIPALTKLAR